MKHYLFILSSLLMGQSFAQTSAPKTFKGLATRQQISAESSTQVRIGLEKSRLKIQGEDRSSLASQVIKSKSRELMVSGQDRGGGRPKAIIEAEVKLLLEGNGLKSALLKYLETLQVNQVQDPVVKSTFSKILKSSDLQKDILSPHNYVIEKSCRDGYNNEVPASTEIGSLGSEICFDAEKIAEDYHNLSSEEVMIRLAALAIHEHVHHFQDPSTAISINENEANRVAAYVLITAKVVQVPVLNWNPQQPPKDPSNAEDLFNKIKQMFDSSSTPYPVEDVVQKSADAPLPFAGCAYANYTSEGFKYWESSSPVIYNWRLTVTPQIGPNDPPPVYKYAIFVGSFEAFNDAVFDKPYRNLDSVSQVIMCNDGKTVRDYFLNLKTGFSSQRKSYVVGGSCNTVSAYFTEDYRQSGEFLVSKTVTPSSTVYRYCWKANANK